MKLARATHAVQSRESFQVALGGLAGKLARQRRNLRIGEKGESVRKEPGGEREAERDDRWSHGESPGYCGPMSDSRNGFGQPVGFPVEGWTARPWPPRTPMVGRWCRVEPLDVARHAAELHEANLEDRQGRNWTYLGSGPFQDLDAYRAWLTTMSAGDDPQFHAVIDGRSGKAVGIASYLRIDPANGVIEVGHINYSPRLQRTTAATEAMALMMRRVFDELGYRRYEWKCDRLNAPSMAAAKRLGFRFEGIFRQAVVYKGRNRDSAWFSMLDREWPDARSEYERWLHPDNFDADGRQRTSLRHV
jgi:RimJ/RimL family protein N-acetyltransferase